MCIYIYRSIYIDLSIFIYTCISISFHRWLFGGKTPISWGVQGSIFAFSSSILLSGLELSDTQGYGPEIRALLASASHFCEILIFELRTPTAYCSAAL